MEEVRGLRRQTETREERRKEKKERDGGELSVGHRRQCVAC